MTSADASMPTPAAPRWALSLRWRLLAATLGALVLALLLAGLLLGGLFRDHVRQQFALGLQAQLDHLTAQLEFDAEGRPLIDARTLNDPRWSRPYGGLYWQVDGAPGEAQRGEAQRGVLRSRSLWDSTLVVPQDELAPGAVHVHEVPGPGGAALLLVERTVLRDDRGRSPWRLMVAGDLADTARAIRHFHGVLAASLAGLLLLLCGAAWAQVAIGLGPLRALQARLTGLRAGTAQRLEGRFPLEVQPLIDDFNAVLDRNAEVVARSRTQAGNLAHAIKTPLAAMSQAAARLAQRAAGQPGLPAALAVEGAGGRADEGQELAALVLEQVAVARRQVEWHLARARAAAAQGLPGARVELEPVLQGLLRVMARVHEAKHLSLHLEPAAGTPETTMPPAPLAFAGEIQDLQEILGNLLDNACKWARQQVQLSAHATRGPAGTRLHIVIDDDGPGIAPQRRAGVLARGARLDEDVPGSGLGLAIVDDLVGLYGGRLQLLAAPSGGLRVEVELPGA